MNKHDSDYPEELPNVELDSDDKIRIIKGLILVFFFTSVGNNFHN